MTGEDERKYPYKGWEDHEADPLEYGQSMGVRHAMVQCEQKRGLTHRIDPLAASDLHGSTILYGTKQVIGSVPDE
jgi:hypothetical protein